MATVVTYLILILLVSTGCNAFVFRLPSFESMIRSNSPQLHADAEKSGEMKKWPGTRPPMPNMELLEQRMDATWGRGKFREEIWNDRLNPSNEWWLAYTPSEEQLQAAAEGFMFSDVEGWCKLKGIDYEKAMEEYKQEINKRFAEYKKEKEEKRKNFSVEKFKKLHKEYTDMQRLAFEYAFRKKDDEKQRAKGQPSLDDEETGEQFLNDKEE